MVACAQQACQRYISLLHRCNHLHHLKSAHAHLLSAGLLRSSSFLVNTLLRAYSRSAEPRHSLSLLLSLIRSSAADHLSFPFALSASSSSFGAQLHSLLLKNGLASADRFIQTALLRLYSHDLRHAHLLFDEIPQPDAIHLDVLMNAFLRHGKPEHALRQFNHWVRRGLIPPDAHTVTTALTACSQAGALDQGVWIHKHLLSNNAITDSFVGSALISMYAKCGSIREAVAVFEATVLTGRDTYLWSAMVSGFAMHGLAKEAMGCLARMQREGLHPDGVVVLGVLSACAHAGFVKEGLTLLAEAERRYGIVPQHEHYSCAIDMLCRVGRLDDAVELIGRMPMRPMASVWGALLTACRTYENVEYAEIAVQELQELATEEVGDDEGVYVQLSNIYMKANKMEEARRVRKMIGSRGVKKTAAYSSVEVDGLVSSFVAGDQAHPMRVEIGRIMEVLNEDISSWRKLALDEETSADARCLE